MKMLQSFEDVPKDGSDRQFRQAFVEGIVLKKV
jgi:hypothetical protein